MSNQDQAFKQTITLVRIEQPVCALSFGQTPCTATGEPCFNTRSTCRDEDQYHCPETSRLFLYFGIPGAPLPADNIKVLPFLSSVSTSPAKISIAGGERDISALGLRASATVTFFDAVHSDFGTDPYVAQRSLDAGTHGSFWSKWAARNIFSRDGMVVRVFEGFEGQSLSEMFQRVYLSESFDFPGTGTVKMKCRDVLVKAANDKAQAPRLSPGTLHADITAGQSEIEIEGAVLADYPTSGTLSIGSEVMTYTSVLTNPEGRLTFSGLSRGTDGTEAAAHRQDDQVQICLRFENMYVDQVLKVLLETYTEINPAFLDLSGWFKEREKFLSSYFLTRLVTKPTSVEVLLTEVCEQSQIATWWDERARLVRMQAIRPVAGVTRRLSEDAHITGDLSLSEDSKKRLTQVWMYFGLKDPTKSLKAEENYSFVQNTANLDLEGPDKFGGPSIRKIYASWITDRTVAFQSTSRILKRYQHAPTEVRFMVTDKDGDIHPGQICEIEHHLITDTFGRKLIKPWMITSVEFHHSSRILKLTAEDASLAGQFSYIVEDETPPHAGDGSDVFQGAYIGNDQGLLPDGTPCALIR